MTAEAVRGRLDRPSARLTVRQAGLEDLAAIAAMEAEVGGRPILERLGLMVVGATAQYTWRPAD